MRFLAFGFGKGSINISFGFGRSPRCPSHHDRPYCKKASLQLKNRPKVIFFTVLGLD
jgi:hypothetical protein